jgi:protein-L-isoaspartate(D-aspartate) O-methyltransferase
VLRDLLYANVNVRVGDGAEGWPERAPFDRVLLTAAAVDVPRALLQQLTEGGELLGPVLRDDRRQEIVRLTRRGDRFELERLIECSFVPMVRPEDGEDEALGPRIAGATTRETAADMESRG